MQKSILVVEDEYLIAADLQSMLEDNGWRVIGPTATVAGALRLLGDELPTAALLDVSLSHETTAPIAEILVARNIPFALATAYPRPELIGGDILRGIVNVGKPTTERHLISVLAELTST